MQKKKVVSNAVCGGFGVGWFGQCMDSPLTLAIKQDFFPCCLLLFVTYHATFCAMHGGAVFYLGRRIKALFIVLLVRSSL